jgi:hypothetical protein
MLINTTSPNSQHILIPINQELNPSSVPLRSDLRKEIIGWDPITSSAEYPHTIDFEQEGCPGLIIKWSLDDFGMTECYFSGGGCGAFTILPISSYYFLSCETDLVAERDLKLVERLLSIIDRPPRINLALLELPI